MSRTTSRRHVLLIDNYDSFTYNLYQYLAELQAQVTVKRNDEISIDECAALQPDLILISPGPGYPKDAGICCDVIRAFQGKIPIAGVCLGMQCMYEVYGGVVGPAGEIVHGKTSKITHDGKGLFENLPGKELTVVRYHSLVGLRDTLPQDQLEITSNTASNNSQSNSLIMGVRHLQYAVEGVQFHPESILTQEGKTMIQNFLNMKL